MSTTPQIRPIHLRLPATSANLGPGFDALGLAMALYLTIIATPADDFHIDATGRDADLCSRLEDNLILTTYMDVLANVGVLAPNLHLKLHNEIPLGMGCGSFPLPLFSLELFWLITSATSTGLTSRSSMRPVAAEGHPDNVAACYLGGHDGLGYYPKFSCYSHLGKSVSTGTFYSASPIRLFSPAKARALASDRAFTPAKTQLPTSRQQPCLWPRSRKIVPSFFALGHEGSSSISTIALEFCPLLPLLLPLMDKPENSSILGVALSGAGLSVLLVAKILLRHQLTIFRPQGRGRSGILKLSILLFPTGALQT